jgi:hypothetical protein
VTRAIAALSLSLCGCEIQTQEVARQCGVDEDQLDSSFEAVDQLPIGQSRVVGRCTLKKVGGSQRVVVLITKDRGLFMPGER